ncbi:hypothetical protein ACSL103130_04250 [Actinomyces slackii]|uniref:Uncharacterized protein n=1 Tax=Actinomyces slackii TaxID=52774 RepID=A0A448K9V1_9ACTO|nr:hypothetical protein [Actinomyces slackii]VEG73680.1 Uncharacterised protein [Actinomyces slackii]
MTQPQYGPQQGGPYGPAQPAPGYDPNAAAGPQYDQFAPTAAYSASAAAQAGAAQPGASQPVSGAYPPAGPGQDPYYGQGQQAQYPGQASQPVPSAQSAAQSAPSGGYVPAAGYQPTGGTPYSSPAPQSAPAPSPAAAATPSLKAPTIILSVSAATVALAIILVIGFGVQLAGLNDGMSEINSNGAVKAELTSNEKYGLYHTGTAPECTVQDPDGEDVSIDSASGRINKEDHFGTFTATSSGAYTITCSGEDAGASYVSELVTEKDTYRDGMIVILAGLVGVLAIFPLIGATIVRARRAKAHQRARISSLSQQQQQSWPSAPQGAAHFGQPSQPVQPTQPMQPSQPFTQPGQPGAPGGYPGAWGPGQG